MFKKVKCSAAFSIVPDQPETYTTNSATKIKKTALLSVYPIRTDNSVIILNFTFELEKRTVNL